jgi:putative membrane protein
VAVILGALNATVGNLLKFLAFIPVMLSFGCFSLVINGLVFWLAGSLSHRLGLTFGVSGFWAGFFGALVSSIVAAVLNGLFLGRERSEPPQGPTNIKIVNP